MSGYVKNHIMYDYFCILKHHIRYCSVVNAKYHIQYDFIRVIQLSYRLPVFRRADPISGLIGNAVPEPSGWSDDIVDSRNGTGGFNGKLFRF